MEEMAEDEFDILDVEQAILSGHISRSEKNDPRGTKYVVEGKVTMMYGYRCEYCKGTVQPKTVTGKHSNIKPDLSFLKML